MANKKSPGNTKSKRRNPNANRRRRRPGAQARSGPRKNKHGMVMPFKRKKPPVIPVDPDNPDYQALQLLFPMQQIANALQKQATTLAQLVNGKVEVHRENLNEAYPTPDSVSYLLRLDKGILEPQEPAGRRKKPAPAPAPKEEPKAEEKAPEEPEEPIEEKEEVVEEQPEAEEPEDAEGEEALEGGDDGEESDEEGNEEGEWDDSDWEDEGDDSYDFEPWDD